MKMTPEETNFRIGVLAGLFFFISAESVCPSSYTYYYNQCYRFESTLRRPREVVCSANGQLLTINTDALRQVVWSHTERTAKGELWVGADDYSWRDGGSIPSSWWLPGEPSSSSSEDCVEVWATGGRDGTGLNDEDCKWEQEYACEAKVCYTIDNCISGVPCEWSSNYFGVNECSECVEGYYSGGEGNGCLVCTSISNCVAEICSTSTDQTCKTCVDNKVFFKLTNSDRNCERMCSWNGHYCWPGSCGNELTSNCQCTSGFRKVSSPSETLCQPNTYPEVLDCQTVFIGPNGEKKRLMSNSPSTHCRYLQDTYGNFQPIKITHNMTSEFTINIASLPHPKYVKTEKFGITDTTIILRKLSTSGQDITISTHPLKVDDTSGEDAQRVVDNNGVLQVHGSQYNLYNGDALCTQYKARAGGYLESYNYVNHIPGKAAYDKTDSSETKCYRFDNAPPEHCLERRTCQSNPLQLDQRVTVTGIVQATFNGWSDPIPNQQFPSQASGIEHFEVRVSETIPAGDTLKVDTSIYYEEKFASDADTNFSLNLTVSSPKLFCVLFEVKDIADNVRQARRFVLSDSTSELDVLEDNPFYVKSASLKTYYLWQTHLNDICLTWKEHFYNNFYIHNPLLNPIEPDPHGFISGIYEQTDGILPVSGTPNVHGIVRYLVSWNLNGGSFAEPVDVQNFLHQNFCQSFPLEDGQSYTFIVTAVDIASHTLSENRTVHIDHSVPHINEIGLIKDGFKGLTVHDDRDLSTMDMYFEALDPHSGILNVDWSFGIEDTGEELGSGVLGVKRIIGDCSGDNISDACYCPDVGSCENNAYLVPLNKLVSDHKHLGDHHREYFFKIKATNIAHLSTTEYRTILVDYSPPEVGGISEGFVGGKDMDYTSEDSIMVHWYGFIDHESGINKYRIGVADRCLHRDELYNYENVSDIVEVAEVAYTENNVRIPVTFTGKMYVSIIAFNNALDPSDSVCSDGITRDTTPPKFYNLTVEHASIVSSVICLDEQPWFVNSNISLSKLPQLSECLTRCSETKSISSYVFALPKSQYAISNSTGKDHCTMKQVLSTEDIIYLPNDHMQLSWGIDASESQIDDFLVGVGTDQSESENPQLISYMSTNRKTLFKHRHEGISPGEIFFIFLKAVSKSGLEEVVAIGPMLIDSTPPLYKSKPEVKVNDNNVFITWDEDTFYDLEQTEQISRIEYTFGLHSNRLEWNTEMQQSYGDASCCYIKYPLTELQEKDVGLGLEFYAKLYVYNNAGHFTEVNTHSFRVPSRYPPEEASVYDLDPEIIKQSNSDIDVHFKAGTLCASWTDSEKEGDVSFEIGVGSTSDKADILPFQESLGLNPFCVNNTYILIDHKYHFLVRAKSSGGTTVSASDGVTILDATSLISKLNVNVGPDCARDSHLEMVTVETTSFTHLIQFRAKLDIGGIFYISTNEVIAPNLEFHSVESLNISETSDKKRFYFTPYIERPRFTLSVDEKASVQTIDLKLFRCQSVNSLSSDNGLTTHWTFDEDVTNYNFWYEVGIFENESSSISVSEFEATHDMTHTFRNIKLQPSLYYRFGVKLCTDNICVDPVLSDNFRVEIERPTGVIDLANIKSSPGKSCFYVTMTWRSFQTDSSILFYQWTISKDVLATHIVKPWVTVQNSNNNQVVECIEIQPHAYTNLFGCVKAFSLAGSSFLTCKTLTVIRTGAYLLDEYAVYDLDYTAESWKTVLNFIHSKDLGDGYRFLHDSELDVAQASSGIAGAILGIDGRNVTWYLMTNQQIPKDDCFNSADCIYSTATDSGYVIWPNNIMEMNKIYYICAHSNTTIHSAYEREEFSSCSNGFAKDNEPPRESSKSISVTNYNGFTTDTSKIIIIWEDFDDSVNATLLGYPQNIRSYSCGLGNKPEIDDIYRFTNVGHSTVVVLRDLYIRDGLHVHITVKASDYAGLESLIVSDELIVDTSPPSTGTILLEPKMVEMSTVNYVSTDSIVLHLYGFEDKESGISNFEVGVGTRMLVDDVLPLRRYTETSVQLQLDEKLFKDGNTYFINIMAINNAGLRSKFVTGKLTIDTSPPTGGHLIDGHMIEEVDEDFSSDLYRVKAHWKGFMDPHSMMHYYNVGFGTRPYADNIRRFRDVGLNQAIEWTGPFISGQKYFTTVEACNHAGLCRTLTSDGILLDNTPPVKGLVKIGSEDFHHRFYPHSHWLHIHWIGFNDPQSGIDQYEVCVGTEVRQCDNVQTFGGLLQTNVIKTEVDLPVNTDLFATVTAYNRVGMNVSQTSESFRIDVSPPVLEQKPRFLNPLTLEEEPTVQWEKSILKIVWLFSDPESPIVNNEITLFTHHEGHTPIEHISVGADDTFTINLRESEWLHNGDIYFVKVTACNAAGRCTTSQSNDLLIDSTPPHLGGFKKPMKWKNYKDNLNEIKTNLTLAWYGFQEQESLIDHFYVTVSRSYSGQELTGGLFIFTAKENSNNYEAEIPLVGKIAQDDILILAIWAENQAGLKSLVERVSVYVLSETTTTEEDLKYGVLEIEKHSCDIHYCNKDCTCAVFGQPCIYHETKPNCTEIVSPMNNGTEFPAVDVRFGYKFDAEQTITPSSACLSGNWKLDNANEMSIKRYEWSIGLKDQPIGEGIFDLKAEQPWNDVGFLQHITYCLPVNRSLLHAENYILYVRAWYTYDTFATFLSRQITVDQSAPSVRKGSSVLDTDESCDKDFDFIDWTDRITGCWSGVFSEHQGEITHYTVAVGTLPQADDILNTKNIGLDTKIQLSNLTLEHGTKYYFTVTVYNTAGLSTSLSSDGFIVDTDDPIQGIAFNSLNLRNRDFQPSDVCINVSWSGFVDYHSGIDRYYVAISETNDREAAETLSFVPVVLKTFQSFTDIELQQNETYYGVVKASDAFGHFSKIAISPGITVDKTKPSGYNCLSYNNIFNDTVVINESGEVTSFLSLNVTKGDIIRVVYNVEGRDYHTKLMINNGLEKTYLHPVRVHDKTMSFGHTFIADKSEYRSMSFTAISKEESQIDYIVSRCQIVTDDQNAVAVKQIGQATLSIDMLIADLDSDLCMLKLGAGTSDGGFQIQSLKQYHHRSNHAIVQTNIAHGSSIYVTVIAENCAGLRSTFKASPVTMDHTVPVIDNVHTFVKFPSAISSGTSESNVKIYASWQVIDEESGIKDCFCALETHPGAEDISQFWKADSVTSCSSKSIEIQEGSYVHFVVKCVNNVELYTVYTTDPVVITYLPPDIEHGKVYVLPSDKDNIVTTFDSGTFLQTNKSSVKIGWCDFEDTTGIVSYKYRLSLGTYQIVDWQRAADVDVVVIGGLNLISGSDYTVEVQATNTNGFSSSSISARVTIVDERPSLTGKPVTLSRQGNLLHLDWSQVFSTLHGIPVSFTLNIGTQNGFSDVTGIIHTTTSSKSVIVPSSTLLTPNPTELYIRISCSYPFGFEQIYEQIYKL